MEYIIKTKNLTKYYGSFFWRKPVPALDGLDIEIPTGAVFGRKNHYHKIVDGFN
jgi:ABC-type multidrug transport system ATPase subunit